MPCVQVNQVDLFYERSGKGRAVVFLHAFAVSSAMWRPQMTAMADHDCECICVDLRGHGKSASPPAPYTVQQMAQDICLFIEQLELENVCLVGLSTGGRIATRIALDSPESIARLVLVSTKSEPAREMLHEMTRLIQLAEAGDLSAAVVKWYQGHYSRLEAINPGLYRSMMGEWVDKPSSGFIGTARAIMEMESVTAQIAKINHPTLAIAGELDPACQPFLAWYERNIPGCRGAIVPAAAHFVNLEQPDLFNTLLLEFLAEQTG